MTNCCSNMSARPNVYDKFLPNMLRTHTLKPQSDSTLRPECCTTPKDNFLVCFKSIFLVCNMSHSCQHKLNSFCHICGEVVLKSQRKPLSKLMRRAYDLYFGSKIRDQDVVSVLRNCCRLCTRTMAGWFKGTHKSISFAVLM